MSACFSPLSSQMPAGLAQMNAAMHQCLSHTAGLFFCLQTHGDAADWELLWLTGDFVQTYGLQKNGADAALGALFGVFEQADADALVAALQSGLRHHHRPVHTYDGKRWNLNMVPTPECSQCWYGTLAPSADIAQTELLQAVLESAGDVVVFAVDAQYRLLAFNEQFRQVQRLLWGKEISYGDSMVDIVQDPVEREDFCQKVQTVLQGQTLSIEDEYGDVRRKREYRQGYWSPIRNKAGSIVGVTVFSLNISQRRQAELDLAHRERELRLLLDNAGDAIVRYDRALRCVYSNAAMERSLTTALHASRLGLTPVEFYGAAPYSYQLEAQLRKAFQSGQSCQFEWQRTLPDGEVVYYLVSISPEVNAAGELATLLVSKRDISELQFSRQRIHQMAFYDSLTGLPNRVLLFERLEEVLATQAKAKMHGAVLMVDIDQFKVINDTMGHAAGDGLLKQAAQRLQKSAGTQATVARVGADEFAILLPSLERVECIARLSQDILQQFRTAFSLDGKPVYVGCSIGAAQFPGDSSDANVLLQYADIAMYAAKAAGRNTLSFYSKEMTRQAQERLALEMDLRSALDKGEMLLYFQPKVEIATGKVTGSEALLRWNHPVQGVLSPNLFIPLAEEVGVIHELGLWVLREACTMAVAWNKVDSNPQHQVAVNLSPRQFQSSDLVANIAATLEQTGCKPEWIELEITEGLLLEDDQSVLRILRSLRAMGLSLAIDDFGTGYSSLRYLARFPIDTLKIDRSFIHSMVDSQEHAELVKVILLMAAALKKKVVAEGVETAEQAAFLQEHGCHFAQGYLYSRPLIATQATGLPLQLP